MSDSKKIPRAIAVSVTAGAFALLVSGVAAADDEKGLEEVVVTAQKRTEALSDIPMSVSVIGGEELERQKAANFQDLVAMLPGLSLNSNTRGVTRVTMRGINTDGVASTVGIYVNDVPFGSSSGLANAAILSGDIDTFDLKRLEVLRGPQGTLYGASSLGGVIKYVTNEPSFAGFEGRLQAGVEDVSGADAGHSLTGLVNVPVSDSFALRASGFLRSDGGWTKSIGNLPIAALQDPGVNIVDGTLVENKINDTDVSGGRVSGLFKPSENFSLDLTAYFQDIKSDNADSYEVDPTTLKPLYGGHVVSRYHNEPTDIEYRLYSATVGWDLGAVSLQSVTSYSKFLEKLIRDGADRDLIGTGLGSAQLLSFAYSTPGTTDKLLSGILDQHTGTDKFTQEVRLLSADSDAFEWLLGAYYTDEDSLISQRVVAVTPGTNDEDSSVPLPADVQLESTYKELALFANATWHITPKFDLSFGGRWSDNDQTAAQHALILLPILPGGSLAIDYDGLKSSEHPFTWSVSPRYEFTDTTSGYLRVATGFRPGGPNVLPPGAPVAATYDSDELTNYEVGLKMRNASGSFSFDAAAFFLDWKDIQLFQNVNGFGINANGGTAESKGLEFSASARSAGLTVTLSGAYTDAKLTQNTDPAVGGFDGDALPFVPKWTLALGGDYEWSAFGDATAYVGGQLSYRGDRKANFDNRLDGADPPSARRVADSYTQIDLRTGVLWKKWSLELYGKNLTDEKGITDIVAPGQFPAGAAAISIIRPRTIGLALGVRF